MRQAAWIAIALFALAVAFSILGRILDAEPLLVLGGLGLLASIAAGVVAIPAVQGLRDRVVPMPDLFPKLGGQRWYTSCGHPAPRDAPCGQCTAPAPRAVRARGHRLNARDNR